jgi:class 3 adenylate cyclase
LIAIAGNGQKYRLDLLFAEIIRDSPADLLQKNGISRSNRFAESLRNMQIALKYAQDYQDVELARDCYRELSHTYEMEKNYKLFHDAYLQYIVMRDSVTNQNSQTALNNKLQQVEFSKQADSLKFREQITQTQLKAKQTEVYYFIAGLIALLGMSFFITRNYINQRKSNKVISFEKQRSDDLLLNILPADVAEELKEKGSADARQFEEVTVLFTDFVNFTTLSQSLSAQQLVDELNVCFKEFDAIMTTHNIEKIKTVGDAYLAVAGLPHADANHAANVINAAKDIQLFMLARKLKMGDQTFGIRIGVHSGSVVAGIVGVKKFAYDIWGDTVNTAARMEQNSEPGKINVSEKTYELVKDLFTFTYRGEIAAKNKGMMKMYFAESPGT